MIDNIDSFDGLVYWGLTAQQQPGSYQGGEMMMMKSVFWWRKPPTYVDSFDLCLLINFHGNLGLTGFG